MAVVGHIARVFEPVTNSRLARSLRGSAATYRELRLPPYSDSEEKPASCLWAKHSLYYWISFLSNIILVICSLSGYIISRNRDSDYDSKNCSRFTIVGAYALPTMIGTGYLFFSTCTQLVRYSKIYETGTHVHIKLTLFCALNSALSFIFMDIYAQGLDDPVTRFGTSDDIRNWLLQLIMFSAAISFLSLLISSLITLSAAAKKRSLSAVNTTGTTLSRSSDESAGKDFHLK